MYDLHAFFLPQKLTILIIVDKFRIIRLWTKNIYILTNKTAANQSLNSIPSHQQKRNASQKKRPAKFSSPRRRARHSRQLLASRRLWVPFRFTIHSPNKLPDQHWNEWSHTASELLWGKKLLRRQFDSFSATAWLWRNNAELSVGKQKLNVTF